MRKNAYILLAALGLASCNYLEIEPVGKVIPHKTSEYRALLTEGYSRFPYTSSKAYTGLLSDEVGMFHEGNFFDSSDAIALSYNYTWQYETQMWEYPYQYYYRAAFQANAVIDGVADADDDSSEDKRQILGEAYAMRAYAHFDLVNLYGKPYDPQTASTDRGVPLSTYIDIEQKYRPTNVAAVYRQIVEDIEAAERTMTLEKQESPTLNYRFSLDALAAFKARVMLYMRNWQAAYDAATGLLPKYELVDFNASPESGDLPWKATSPEAILAWERPFGGGIIRHEQELAAVLLHGEARAEMLRLGGQIALCLVRNRVAVARLQLPVQLRQRDAREGNSRHRDRLVLAEQAHDVLAVCRLDLGKGVSQQLLLQMHDLLAGVHVGELQIKAGEFGRVLVGVGLLGAENGTCLKDALQPGRHRHLLVELR